MIAIHPALRSGVPLTGPAIRERVKFDASALAQSGANTLIIGDQFAVLRALGTVWPSFKKSVRWVDGTRLSLPVESCGTLILEKGHRLSERDQADLLGWLNDRGRPVRVLTTAPRPLFPLVEAGSFHACLYYRLNEVLIAVG
jgi:Sigma-54 interaction domain